MARQVMNAEEIRRALTRISHEIIEKEGTEGLVVVGIQRRGVPLAKVIVDAIKEHKASPLSRAPSISASIAMIFQRSPLPQCTAVPRFLATSPAKR